MDRINKLRLNKGWLCVFYPVHFVYPVSFLYGLI